MLAWIVDHANFFSFAFGAAAVVLFAAGWTTRRLRYWGYAGGCFAVVLIVWLLGHFIPTDRKQIESHLRYMATATIERRPGGVLKHLSKDFRFGSTTGEDLQKRIRATIDAHKVRDIHLWAVQTKVDGDIGETVFNFRADAENGSYPATAKARFVREDGDWKLRELTIYKLGTTDRQHVPGVD